MAKMLIKYFQSFIQLSISFFGLYFIFQHMSYGKPQPQRFQFYTELPNKKGFTIKDCKLIFKYDHNGGWKDQFGNYYNSNGEPAEQPDDDTSLTPSEGSLQSDCSDEYDKLFRTELHEEDHEEEHFQYLEAKHFEKVSKNTDKLMTYPASKELRVFFSNAPYRKTEREIYDAFEKKNDGIINVKLRYDENSKKTGEGYFIVRNVNSAENLIKLEGEKIFDREFYFNLEDLQELILDPLTEEQLKPLNPSKSKLMKEEKEFSNKKGNSKFTPKEEKKDEKIMVTKEEKKTQKREEKKEVIREQKEEKKEEKKQKKEQRQKPEFSTYELNFHIFNTKTKFVNWMGERDGKRDVDYKNIDKKQVGEKTVITMDVRNKLVEKIKGEKYDGKEVIFTPL